jgi:hypothetical protein
MKFDAREVGILLAVVGRESDLFCSFFLISLWLCSKGLHRPAKGALHLTRCEVQLPDLHSIRCEILRGLLQMHLRKADCSLRDSKEPQCA